MPSKSEQKAQSHETILASAERLVRERGIGGARVADVMAGANLTVGGFYAHFESKAALVDETLRRTGAKLRERLFSRLDAKPEADRALVVLKRYLSAAHRDLEHDGCPLPAVVGEIAVSAPEHRDVLKSEVEALAQALAQELPEHPVLPPKQLALALVALMFGGLTLARALRGTELSDELLRASRALGTAALGRARG